MSSAIKPPGSGPVGGAGAPPESGGAGGVQGSSEDFRAELDKAGATQREGSASTAANVGSSRAELLRSLAEDLRAGRIDPQQAVDQLVERTLSGGAAASLPPARRAELEALLRSTLDQDPTLAAMQRDLSRDR